MQRPPLPVDVVTSWTDIAGLIVNSFAALGTVGALLIAASAYSRQVDDAQRSKAMLVSMKKIESPEDDKVTFLFDNRSDQTVYDAVVFILGFNSAGRREWRRKFDKLQPYTGVTCERITEYESWRLSASVTFTDQTGRRWRHHDGGIRRMNRLRIPRIWRR